ncbi:MAG: hypothetical protein RIC55_04105 [Pirellulaceae bacterium]
MSNPLNKNAMAALVVCALTVAGMLFSGSADKIHAAQSEAPATAEQVESSLDEELQLLRRNGVAADTESILGFLRRQQPSAAQQREIDALIKQLSSAKFAEREAATRKLAQLGPAARAGLVEMAQSKDLEAAFRSKRILQQLESDQHARDAMMLAALQILKQREQSESAPVLLRTLPLLEDVHMRGLASEAIWACTEATHAALLREGLADEDQQVQAAALVALELALGDEAVATIAPYLKDDSAVLRLAAARALADLRPRECIAALVELTAVQRDGIDWQADALLQMLSGKRMVVSSEATLAEAWRAWSQREAPTAALRIPLGRRRLDLTAGRHAHHETFSRPAKSLAKGYGDFQYEADNGGPASVVNGALLIDGDNDEGDQRLFVTAQRMIGRGQWPKGLEVRAKLGGKEGNNYGWHVGVSVGRVKVLFHPGLSGGAFRAETTDTHESLFTNEEMGFTPATGAMHAMLVKVSKTADGAEFKVTVSDAGGKSQFNRTFTATTAQLGDDNRIGLERSGRRGGDAVFDSVSIQVRR